jgi:hypothetical protein
MLSMLSCQRNGESCVMYDGLIKYIFNGVFGVCM